MDVVIAACSLGLLVLVAVLLWGLELQRRREVRRKWRREHIRRLSEKARGRRHGGLREPPGGHQ